MEKDFNEFLEMVNSPEFNEAVARSAQRTFEESCHSDEQGVSEAQAAMAYAQEFTVSAIQLYHHWVNS